MLGDCQFGQSIINSTKNIQPWYTKLKKKRANETGNVYGDDIEDLRQSYDKLWDMAEGIMVRLAAI